MDIWTVVARARHRHGTWTCFGKLPGVILAAFLGVVVEAGPAFASEGAVPEILPTFNALCDQLSDGRHALQTGRLAEDAFVDLVLDLFTRADSLSQLLAVKMPSARGYTTASALARGLRYLKASLRSNYEGIARKDGYTFVVADLDFQAALAWRSSITGVAMSTP